MTAVALLRVSSDNAIYDSQKRCCFHQIKMFWQLIIDKEFASVTWEMWEKYIFEARFCVSASMELLYVKWNYSNSCFSNTEIRI